MGQAEKILGLSRTFVHRIASQSTTPSDGCPEFDAIDEAVARYVLG